MRIGSWDEIGGIPNADTPPEVIIELLTLQEAKE